MRSLLEKSSETAPMLVAGRYRIETRIARGGMGVVYAAFDLTSQRKVALKRLVAESDVRRRTRMFEREYRALAGLKHPRIIEVFDYGVDERGAYYTMELLDGRDLRELAPLPYPTACRYLRDVASSLALLHARNLLHRDLSARNVRVTSDDRAKLIDFGTLSGFGKNAMVAGTAPGVPPEALYGDALDQRADLYALGALAYWVLTGLHAFDVRTLDELPAAWSRPLPSVSGLAPKGPDFPQIPKQLDDLIAALLSKNRLARPASAAEVIAHLSAIARLPPDDEPLSALSYLRGGRTVGHERERDELRKRLSTAVAGSGSLALIEAEPGMHSSRILADLGAEARLLGVTAVVVDASEHRGAFAVAERIVHELLAVKPEQTRAAMSVDAQTLARFVPNSEGIHSTQRLSAQSDQSGNTDPREARLRMQTALLACLQRLASELPLLVAVHNLEHADENSIALLCGLADGIGSGRMLLALAYDPNKLEPTTPALAQARERALCMRLPGLSHDEVRALVDETFGEVPNTERLAGWLHQLTGGNPQGCLDLMRYLLDHSVISFVDGVWTLPQELAPEELPKDLGQALDARIGRLSADALRLAALLAIYRGAMPIERCEALAEAERIAEPIKLLSELEQSGVLVPNEERVRFSHGSLRDAVQRRLDERERRTLHARLGALLAKEASSDPEDLMDAGWHLLHGGDEARGAELLAKAGLLVWNDAGRLPEAIPALEAALTVFRKQPHAKHKIARLLGTLTIAGFHADRKTMETYGDEGVALLREVLGLDLAKRLRPWLGARASLLIGLGAGLLGFVRAQGPRTGLDAFRATIALYGPVASVLTALASMTLDAERARRYAELLEPLVVLGEDHAATIVYRFASALASMPEDRVVETLKRCRAQLARLDSDRPIVGLEPQSLDLIKGGVLYALGSLESFRDNPEALAIADRLESMGLKLLELFANQIRANHHGLRGETPLADRYRRRVELFAMQAGSGWQAEVWAPSSEIVHHMLSGDVIGLRRVAGELERLSQELPTFERYARLSLAAYQFASGDYASARTALTPILAECGPRAFIGWAVAASAHVRNLAVAGELEAARDYGRWVLGLYDAEDRQVSTLLTLAVVELALVEAELGELEVAAARVDDYLAELGTGGGPTTLGRLYEARVRIAQRARDGASARASLSRMEQCVRPTEAPALIARFERLRKEVEDGLDEVLARAKTADAVARPDARAVRTLLECCASVQERWDRALVVLLEHMGGEQGYLFSYDDGQLTLVSPRTGAAPAHGLRERLLAEIERQTSANETTVLAKRRGDTPTQGEHGARGSHLHRSFVLGVQTQTGRMRVVAAAAISDAKERRDPPQQLVSALAEGLEAPLAATSPGATKGPRPE